MSRGMKVLVGVVVVFGLMQLVPIDRSNPPVEGPLQTPPEVAKILERSCNDCHSNQSRWPWYGYVAPVSWLLWRDIHEGREHMNFSTWQRYDAKQQAKKFKEIWEEVDEGEMPMAIYLVMHSDAKLSAADKDVLHNWTTQARASLGVTLPTTPEGAAGEAGHEEHEH